MRLKFDSKYKKIILRFCFKQNICIYYIVVNPETKNVFAFILFLFSQFSKETLIKKSLKSIEKFYLEIR